MANITMCSPHESDDCLPSFSLAERTFQFFVRLRNCTCFSFDFCTGDLANVMRNGATERVVADFHIKWLHDDQDAHIVADIRFDYFSLHTKGWRIWCVSTAFSQINHMDSASVKFEKLSRSSWCWCCCKPFPSSDNIKAMKFVRRCHRKFIWSKVHSHIEHTTHVIYIEYLNRTFPEEYDELGRLQRTCNGEVQVNKCEGLCNSQVQPSVITPTGFLKECYCCRESYLHERLVTLSHCYDPDGTRLMTPEMASMDIRLKEPAECRCFKCGDFSR